ncbi:hypothetical protein [Variovorax sp. UC74_104]
MPTSITRSCRSRSDFTCAWIASSQRSYGAACCRGALASKE